MPKVLSPKSLAERGFVDERGPGAENFDNSTVRAQIDASFQSNTQQQKLATVITGHFSHRKISS